MATRIQVRRLANPRKRVNVKRRNATKRRRKMSPKQIRIFGTKAQKAALRRKKNPTARKVSAPKKRANRKRRTRRTNPALVVTLGAMNPRRTKRRNKPMAKAKRNRRRVATNTRRRRRRNPRFYPTLPAQARARRRSTNKRRRRRNPSTRIVVVAPRRANRRRRVNSHRRRVHHRRRNPMNTSLFGAPLFGRSSLELLGGGLVGVAAAKFIPTLLPGSLTAGIASTNIGRTVITGIAAVVGGWAGSKVSPQFGQGMLFGGMMQTLSVALNAFLPSVYSQLGPYSSLGRVGVGDLMPGGFSVPQNPLMVAPPPPSALPPAGAQVRAQMNGLARAYGNAF